MKILKTVEPAKSNLTREEQLALKKIRNDESLVALKADKGNAVVIMDA